MPDGRDMTSDAMCVAKALRRLANEHGLPNRFAPWEVSEAGGPASRMRIGRVGRSSRFAELVRLALAVDGVRLVEYADRHFRLETK